MSNPMPSWRTVAIALGHRMANYRYCGDHPLSEADPDTCPFCADRAAYLLLVSKLRSRQPKSSQ